MTILIQNIETNGLNPTKIHCIATKEFNAGSTVSLFTDMDRYREYMEGTKPTCVVFHNGLAFDVPVINRLVKHDLIKHGTVIDTMVVSKLFDYKKFNTHSLKELGEHLKVYKGEYTGGWETYTPMMGAYCNQDVLVTEAIFNSFWSEIQKKEWHKALRTEHDMTALCNTMSVNGFKFNKTLANSLLEGIVKEMDELEDSFKLAFPAKLVEVKRNPLRYTKDGNLYVNLIKDMAAYPKVEVEDEHLVCYDYKEFNAGSPKDRIDELWKAGWKPFDKTDGHKKHLRSKYHDWT